MYFYTYICIYIYGCVYVCVCMYMCICIYMYVYVCVYIYMYMSLYRMYFFHHFFHWATPVKPRLCSMVICMLVDCLLDQFLARFKKEFASHIQCISSTSLNSRWSTCVAKRCCTISRTSLTSCAPNLRSFIILSKSARESHTLPPAKPLRQNSTGLAFDFLDFHLRLAFDTISSDPLSFDVCLPLSA